MSNRALIVVREASGVAALAEALALSEQVALAVAVAFTLVAALALLLHLATLALLHLLLAVASVPSAITKVIPAASKTVRARMLNFFIANSHYQSQEVSINTEYKQQVHGVMFICLK